MSTPSRPLRLPSGVGRGLPRKRPRLIGALLLAALIQISSGAGAAWMSPGLDGMSGIRLTGGLDAAPQWQRALARQSQSAPAGLRHDEAASAAQAGWDELLASLAQEPRAAQIKAVNHFVNQVRYREDAEAWGAPDYWATPGEFFERGGDCEDYAIAKYFALRALGLPASQLFILVLRDEIKRVGHAVLLVAQPSGALILDNRSNRIVPWQELRDHRPIYWVNETSGWLRVAGK